MLMIFTPITMSGIDGMHTVFTEIGQNASIQRQLITPLTTWLSVEPLPGYAHELNPVEQVWGTVKSKELANLCSDSIAEVADVAEAGLDRIGSDASLCFAFLRHTGLRLSR